MGAFAFKIVGRDTLPVCYISKMEEGEGVIRADIEIGPPLHPYTICMLDIKDTEL
jgi:hypothetical protein